VAGIFHDASIGNAVHVILVRLILLQGDEVVGVGDLFSLMTHLLKLTIAGDFKVTINQIT